MPPFYWLLVGLIEHAHSRAHGSEAWALRGELMAGRGKFARLTKGTRYERLRRQILDAANWRCSTCGSFGNEVHHVRALHKGGAPYDPDNLQVLCRTHHIETHRPIDPARKEWADFLKTFQPETGGSNHVE